MARRPLTAAAPRARASLRALAALAVVALVVVPRIGATGAARVTAHAPQAAFVAHLDAQVPRWMSASGVPGVAVALVVDGETVWSGAYGLAERATRRPMTVDTYLRTESISKSATAWAVMWLVDQGLVGLDDPVARHLRTWAFPADQDAGARVTVRQLLSHTAGLRHGDIDHRYAPGADRPTLRAHLTEQVGFVQEPGTGFAYSNVGFNLLEVLIEDVSGMDFASFVEERIFAPLEMERATFAWREGLDPPVPTGHDLTGRPTPPYVYPERASGGLLASVEAVARFAAAGASGSQTAAAVLSPAAVAEMHAPQVRVGGYMGAVVEAYGLGHFVETLPDGRRAVSHGGQGYGWMTHFHAVPESGDAIVLLTNSQRSWPFFARVLGDWARWLGLPTVGMARIRLVEAAVWVIVGAVLFAAVWGAWGLAADLIGGRRRVAPGSRTRAARRLAQGAAAVAILATLAWAGSQPYLFLPSVVPVAWPYLTGSAVALAVVALADALLPART